MALDVRIMDKLTEAKSELREMLMSGAMIASVIYCIYQHNTQLAKIAGVFFVAMLVWEAVSGISKN